MGWDGTGMNCNGMGWDRTEKYVPWTSLNLVLQTDRTKFDTLKSKTIILVHMIEANQQHLISMSDRINP